VELISWNIIFIYCIYNNIIEVLYKYINFSTVRQNKNVQVTFQN